MDASNRVCQEVGSEFRLRERGRLAYLDGLGAVAALYVVVPYAVLIAAPAHRGARTEGARLGWLPPGHFAVAVFIVASGFCLTLPIAGKGDPKSELERGGTGTGGVVSAAVAQIGRFSSRCSR